MSGTRGEINEALRALHKGGIPALLIGMYARKMFGDQKKDECKEVWNEILREEHANGTDTANKRRGPLPEFKDQHASLMRVRKAASDLCKALTINGAGELVAPVGATRKLDRALDSHRLEFGGE